MEHEHGHTITRREDRNGKGEPYSYGVHFEDIMNAAEVCGNTSVLEKLFPWAFNTDIGKEILERKKAEEKKEPPKPEKTEEDEITLSLTKREARVLRFVTGNAHGDTSGPMGDNNNVYQKLCDLVPLTYSTLKENTAKLPNTWEEFDKNCRG